ncbi:MAG: Spy/CpxP family protein refolding chaperone [Candidatus Neomarinimicrobiota bacterium]
MKNIIVLLILNNLFSQGVFAKKDRHERKETMIIWKLTEELELTSEQAEKFFPKHREHRADIEKLKKRIENLGQENLENFDNLSSKEINRIIKERQDLKKKIIDIETEFIFGMENLLNSKQIVLLATFKSRIMNDMRADLKGKKKHKKKKKKRKKSRGIF